jgi:hypothetical protein
VIYNVIGVPSQALKSSMKCKAKGASQKRAIKKKKIQIAKHVFLLHFSSF